MRAIVYRAYGSPDVLQIEEMPKPEPRDQEILVKVLATTVTSGDWHLRSADPFLVRLYNGLFKPRRHQILGSEFAGIVHSVGAGVKSFRVGDGVFGASNDTLGAHAEYLRISENAQVTTIPAQTSWEDAASIPFGALTALFFLRDLAGVQAGQRVLIMGASGAVGSYSVQLAKYYGLEVTGICSTKNVEMVKSLGADHVIDYTTTNVITNGDRYDIIFDTVGKLSYLQSRRILNRKGIFLTTSFGPRQALQLMWTPITGKPVRAGIAKHAVGDMEVIADMMKSGAIKPVIDRCYPFERIAEAHAYVEKGHKRGSVVISPIQSSNSN